MWVKRLTSKPEECMLCHKSSPYISRSLRLCADCIRSKPEEAEPLIFNFHQKVRSLYGLPSAPPKTQGGIPCNLCANECVMGKGERGYCGLRMNVDGKLITFSRPREGLLYAYKDPHVTNCLSYDSIVTLADGRVAEIGKIVEEGVKDLNRPVNCISLNFWSLQPSMAAGFHRFKAPQRLVKITLESGLSLTVTPDHRFMIDDIIPKYVEADKLKPGQRVLSVSKIVKSQARKQVTYVIDHMPENMLIYDKGLNLYLKGLLKEKYGTLKQASKMVGISYKRLRYTLNPKSRKYLTIGQTKKLCESIGCDWEDLKGKISIIGLKKPVKLGENKLTSDHLYLLGLIFADGHVRKLNNIICFTNSDDALLAVFERKYKKLFPELKLSRYVRPKGMKKGRKKRVTTKTMVKVLEGTNPVLAWLYRKLLMAQFDCYTMPLNLGWLPESHIAAFISGVIDGDGFISSQEPRVEVAFKDRRNGEMFLLLLRRLGIYAKIRFDKHGLIFKVIIRSARDIALLRKIVNLNVSNKKLKFSIDFKEKNGWTLSPAERLPMFVGSLLKALRKHHRLFKRELHHCVATITRYENGKRSPRRYVIKRILAKIKSVNTSDPLIEGLSKIFNSGLMAEKITKVDVVENQSVKVVYDITVKPVHNFITYGVITKNCCSAWFCPAGTGLGYPEYAVKPGPERGYANLAVFFYGCNFDCLFCQNWSHKDVKAHPTVRIERLIETVLKDRSYTCVCFFGGSPEPQLPFALNFSRMVRESQPQRVMRICFEWNGCGHPKLVREAAELAYESGGNIKFDLKTYTPQMSLALSGVSNRRAYENFEMIYREFYDRRRKIPVLTATTLLVPGYVDEVEVESIARFLGQLSREIPYSLLVFHPDFEMSDLPVTPRRQVERCYQAARRHLDRVNIGNLHLLGFTQ